MSVVGVVSDIHLPWAHPKYLQFCKDTFKRFKVNRVVFIGDVVDSHAMSRFEPNPEGYSPGDEIRAATAHLRPWVKAFPKAMVCIGNHDERYQRRAYRYGIPSCLLKSYQEVFNTPGWDWQPEFKIDGVLYIHGTGSTGKDAAMNLALQRRMSTVQGHTHSYAGCKWHANPDSLIFGMNVGCGIDIDSYAFEYSKPFPVRPVLGCGVVIDGTAMFIPMPCSKGQRYHRGEHGQDTET